MSQNFSVIVNGVIFNESKVLVSQRSWDEQHEPGKWTIPGGKVEYLDENFGILTRNLEKEIKEEVGIQVDELSFRYVVSNCFKRNDGSLVLAIVFACKYKDGKPMPLEDTIDVGWINKKELDELQFPQNVKEYIVEAYTVMRTGVID